MYFGESKGLSQQEGSFEYPQLGLPRLRNFVNTKFVNVYTSSTNRNDPVYTELPDLIIFIMQIGKIANIFPKKTSLKNVPCANIRN